MLYPIKLRFKNDNKLINKYRSKILHYYKKINKDKYKYLYNEQQIILNKHILEKIKNHNIWAISFTAFMLCAPYDFKYIKISKHIKTICNNIFECNNISIIINTVRNLYPHEVNMYLSKYLKIIKKKNTTFFIIII
ncbi:hypothetical protein CHBEV_172 [Choristoneura biennis entomopoxvirus]|uniref:Uncharacterized protein n=1 Tax=Choristoneura biennis entomopoxvirus TaxID=10288 RepID=A0A916P6U1_CBEPV|nr:hypothetical protein CHBEV_172 [Choristoneura biennis entomopoxvirus]CCU55740.1 hypothetical protein CHBEV_172 [Choristoneura biennis entomopoxvirus]